MPENTPLNVLMIDDDPDDNFLFEEAILQSSCNIKISFASDQKSIYNHIRSKPTDVILLDINMPAKDGLEYLREFKSHNQIKDIPVIIFSTSKHMTEDCFQQGASKYFVKPDNFDAMKKLVQKIDNQLWKSTSTSANDGFVIDYSR